MAATTNKQTKKDAERTPAPSFYRWQLVGCRELDASRDVIMAVLDDGKTYTISEAKKAINDFMNRKV